MATTLMEQEVLLIKGSSSTRSRAIHYQRKKVVLVSGGAAEQESWRSGAPGAPTGSRPESKHELATWVQAGPELGTQCEEAPQLLLHNKVWQDTAKLKARHA